MTKEFFIDDYTEVSDEGVKIYRGARVIKSNLGRNVVVGDDSRITESVLSDKVEIARRNNIQFSKIGVGTQTGDNTVIQAAEIGKYCAISWNVTVGGGNHFMNNLALTEMRRIFDDEVRTENPYLSTPLKVGSDVWIAAGVHVLRGVEIGHGAVLGAGAVVTKSVPPYAVVGGGPARIIKYRFSEQKIEKLLKLAWWDFPDELLARCKQFFVGELTDEKLERLISLKEEYEK